MPRPARLRLAPLLVAVLPLLAACEYLGQRPAEPSRIEIKQRSRPSQAYRLSMTIDDPPGPFAVVEGSAQYDVANHIECGYLHPVTRIISRITTHVPIRWERVGDNEYVATVHPDLIINEDYYGRGTCRWKFTAASAMLRASTDPKDTRFLPGISSEDIAQGKAVTLYFWKAGYPRESMDGYGDSGHPDPSRYRPELRDELFSVTIKPKDVLP